MHHLLATPILLLAVSAEAQTVLYESFENPAESTWNGGYLNVTRDDPVFIWSDLSGVSGSRFQLLGSGYFEFSTQPGLDYELSYKASATDSYTQPNQSGAIFLHTRIYAFHGTEVIDRHGNPQEVPILIPILSDSSEFLLPGVSNWKIDYWVSKEFTFTAVNDFTRIYLSSPQTFGYGSYAAIDELRVQVIPEPSTLFMLPLALISLFAVRYRKRGMSERD